MAYWLSQTLLTAVRLGLFEQLALGPGGPGQIAQALGLNEDATGRLLCALANMGYVVRDGQAFVNAPISTVCLVRSSPGYIGGIAHQHAELLWPLWEHLPTAVKEGRPALREAFGGDRNPFDVLTTSPEKVAKLIAGMHAGAKGMAECLLMAHDFTGHRHLMDVGGGSGIVTAPVAHRYPHLRVTIFDLPQVCAILPEVLKGYGLGHRLAALGGDFFKAGTFPTGCDGAVICRVLHDWSDEKALAILKNVHQALTPGGAVLVVEHLLDTDQPMGRLFVSLSDLTMLVMTDGGRERTGSHYEALLSQAGFARVATSRVSPPVAVIRGQKL